MARFGVLALALLASAYAAEEVCAEGQCAESAEEAALLQSTAAQKLAEVTAHSSDAQCTATCFGTAAYTCCDNTNKCYYDPNCAKDASALKCIGGTMCTFCDCPGGGCPACPATPPPSPSPTCVPTCGATAATTCCDNINPCVYNADCANGPANLKCIYGTTCTFCDCPGGGCPACSSR